MRIYWLIGTGGDTRQVALPIKGPLLVGRGTYNHVVLEDLRISRQHARIDLEREGCVVYDLGSTNGTFVNGVPIRRHVLRVDDDVKFGSLAFRITAAEVPKAAAEDSADLEAPTVRGVDSETTAVTGRPAGRERDSTHHLGAVDMAELEDAYDNLGTLYTFLQAISQTIETSELLELIGAKTQEILKAANGVSVYLLVQEDDLSAFKLAHFVGAPTAERPPVTLPEEISSAILGSPQGILTPPRMGEVAGGGMYAPMMNHNEMIGVIHVAAEPSAGGFTRANLEMLSSVAAPAATILRSVQKRQELLQRDRLRYDLELAAQIQRSFLPREVVSVEGVELFAEYRAAYSVGGDFYDVFWVAPNRLGVFVGDISGKGVAGALLMARISSEMRVTALTYVDPVTVFTALNTALIDRNQPEQFFTAVYLTFDVKSGEVVLANAGHPSPYLKRAGGELQEIMEGASAPVGIVDDPHFESTVIRLGHGDSLVLYTDGVVEASAANGSLYGTDRLENVLAAAETRPHKIAERILASVNEHLGGVAPSDDITLFVCQRAVGRPPSLQPRRRSGTHAFSLGALPGKGLAGWRA